MTEKTITYQNSSVSYRIVGEGKMVVLIHGFAEDGDIWNNQVNFLKDHFRIIIPDIPGSGHSELIANAGIETYAEVIKQILEAEMPKAPFHKQGDDGSGEVTMIGHSMGGYITLAFAEKYPQYLNSFGLFHSTAFADNDEKKQVRAKAIEFIKDNGAMAFLITSIPALFTKAFTEAFPERINDLVKKGEKFSAGALVQYYEAMIARPDRKDVLIKFPKPILFIIGEFDTAIPFQSSLQQCYLPAQSHVHILDRSAHMGMWEETDKSNRILYQFLL